MPVITYEVQTWTLEKPEANDECLSKREEVSEYIGQHTKIKYLIKRFSQMQLDSVVHVAKRDRQKQGLSIFTMHIIR